MPIMKIMKASKELTLNQKLCVFSFDEIKVKESYCYDKSTDTTLKPASYVQVGMLRGKLTLYKMFYANIIFILKLYNRPNRKMETAYLL